MSIRFACPSCGKKLKAPDHDAGRSSLCSGCGQKVRIPFADGSTAESVAHRAAPTIDTEHAAITDAAALDPFGLMPKASQHPHDLIDMTAMVDIVFFMLIFFMVASAQAIVAVMPFPPAQAQSGAAGKVKTVSELQTDPEFLTVRIEAGDEIWIEDEQVYGEMAIRTRLRAEKAKETENRGVLVIGNFDATHGAAVLVFDACMDAGYDDIRVSYQETTEDAQ
ncbi:MAG: biopolymer transporter ExbD [Planctomycetaceae bacterium]|nr:biopolymer transporter ExbD [Planctomycetaceae bacterium]